MHFPFIRIRAATVFIKEARVTSGNESDAVYHMKIFVSDI
jgi:hypothetical protein